MSSSPATEGPSVDASSSALSSSSPVGDQRDMLILLMQEVRGMRQEMMETKEESKQLREQNVKLSQQLRVAERRVTRILPPSTPFSSPPKVSSMTHSAYANLNTPSVRTRQSARLSVGDTAVDVDEKVDEEDEEDGTEDLLMSDTEEMKKPLQPRKERRAAASDEAAKVAKVMAKVMEKPVRFSGETEKEREEVEAWAEDVTAWLDTQFGQFSGDYPEAEWTLVQSLLGGTAKQYMRVAKQTDPSQTWETMKQGFIDFIRGGQESRELWRQKMNKLVYGRGKCRDLLSLEKEFEQLRIKLHPTSSSNLAMNREVGQMYGQAIERGDPLLAAEMQRILAVHKDDPTLRQWKSAAVKAERIQRLTAAANSVRGGGRDQPRWGHRHGGDTRTPGATVNQLSGDGEVEEEDSEDPGAASVQQMQGRKGTVRRTPQRSPPLLTDEEYQQVMAKGLCLQCYKTGHRIKDCKEKGQKRRKPTAEELKG
jgi:hypothetical protein